MFSAKGVPEEIEHIAIRAPLPLAKLLVEAGLAASNAEGRRLIEQGAVSIDEARAADPFAELPGALPIPISSRSANDVSPVSRWAARLDESLASSARWCLARVPAARGGLRRRTSQDHAHPPWWRARDRCRARGRDEPTCHRGGAGDRGEEGGLQLDELLSLEGLSAPSGGLRSFRSGPEPKTAPDARLLQTIERALGICAWSSGAQQAGGDVNSLWGLRGGGDGIPGEQVLAAAVAGNRCDLRLDAGKPDAALGALRARLDLHGFRDGALVDLTVAVLCSIKESATPACDSTESSALSATPQLRARGQAGPSNFPRCLARRAPRRSSCGIARWRSSTRSSTHWCWAESRFRAISTFKPGARFGGPGLNTNGIRCRVGGGRPVHSVPGRASSAWVD